MTWWLTPSLATWILTWRGNTLTYTKCWILYSISHKLKKQITWNVRDNSTLTPTNPAWRDAAAAAAYYHHPPPLFARSLVLSFYCHVFSASFEWKFDRWLIRWRTSSAEGVFRELGKARLVINSAWIMPSQSWRGFDTMCITTYCVIKLSGVAVQRQWFVTMLSSSRKATKFNSKSGSTKTPQF